MIFFKMTVLRGDKCITEPEFTAGTRNANFPSAESTLCHADQPNPAKRGN